MSRAEISTPDLGPEPPPDEVPGAARWPSRTVVALAAAAGCAVVLVAAGARLTAEATRGPTAAERAAASTAEVARRYRAWPAGRIFPAEVPYTPAEGAAETARRVGIGTDTRCGTAVDAALVGPLAARGCRAVLRATYLDQPQGLAVTVGVAAFPDERSARAAAALFPSRASGPGLRALPFAGSVAARFGDAARQSSAVAQTGPYVVAATVGYADGRPTLRARQQQADVPALAPRVAAAILRPLTTPAPIHCNTQDWSC
ncbi:hypothetical protein [Actinomadura fibrosa]|uniref:Uncharacterized protein n=1 Tax=Actinomadura fibrosa TaxID=111802 RepID=A0ABW2X9I2_9ACTN